MQNKKKLLLLSIIQFILLLALLGNIMYFKQSADTFKIKSQSMDPVEPLLGHYAALSYDFDSITMKDWKGKAKPKEGEKVYIIFKKGQNDLYQLDYVTNHRPNHSKYIKATIQYTYYDEAEKEEIRINHNLSRFYIPEGQMDKYNQGGTKYIVTIQHKGDRSVVKAVEVQ
ncbi:GDYXXLXY domain-containing protein [Bacillus sp. AFS055030]|uniref:GDYXXLXY domain-containing protein n=1 Tax=Bacillus sp. AFS055030 TaxID=2033507 RepID=UPI0015D4B47B|nr:GDYXXLXY domain-containing protein [Bacillus sp. AFS055030]